jgi:hypothetical protein
MRQDPEVSYNTIKRHLQVLINEAVKLGMNKNPPRETTNAINANFFDIRKS